MSNYDDWKLRESDIPLVLCPGCDEPVPARYYQACEHCGFELEPPMFDEPDRYTEKMEREWEDDHAL